MSKRYTKVHEVLRIKREYKKRMKKFTTDKTSLSKIIIFTIKDKMIDKLSDFKDQVLVPDGSEKHEYDDDFTYYYYWSDRYTRLRDGTRQGIGGYEKLSDNFTNRPDTLDSALLKKRF
jgi:hypothetical protein